MQLLLLALAVLPASAFLSVLYRRSIFHQLRSDRSALVFSQCTSDLNTQDIILVMLLLVVEKIRSLVRSNAGTSIPKTQSRVNSGKTSTNVTLPNVSVTMKVVIGHRVIDQYHEALGTSQNLTLSDPASSFRAIAGNNAHLALFLSAISAPALLLLLARPECPIDPLGSVNVRNFIRIIHPELCRQVVQQGPNSTGTKQGDPHGRWLTARALPQPEARRVNRGIETDIRVIITLHQAVPQQESIEIFEQIFTVLQFIGTKSSEKRGMGSETSETSSTSPTVSSSLVDVPRKALKTAPRLASYFKIKYNDPQLWAQLCKDYNPIHISGLAARLFGFRSKIAHGNHVVAKSIAALLQSGDEKFSQFCGQQDGQELWMQVEFKRPILLPAEVGVRLAGESPTASRSRREYTAFEVFKGEKVHIEAAVGAQIS